MEPFNVSKAVLKSISAVGSITYTLQQLVDTYNDAPGSIKFTLTSVEVMGLILSSLKSLLDDLLQVDATRRAMIELDHLVIALTQTILTLLELENAIKPFKKLFRSQALWNAPGMRLVWMKKEFAIMKAVHRLTSHKASLSLILSIMQT
jgi:hypothetical protein